MRSVFDKTPYITHHPEALNYCDGYWVKHPVQNNSFALPIEERINIIKSFIERDGNLEISNYEEWLFYQYGPILLTNIQVDIRESIGVAKLMSCLLIG